MDIPNKLHWIWKLHKKEWSYKGYFNTWWFKVLELDMQVTKATFNAMKASSMARRLTTKSARRKSAWLLINKY